MKSPPRNTTKLKSLRHRQPTSLPVNEGGRTAQTSPRVLALSVRNPSLIHATGELYFLELFHPLRSGMETTKQAADEAAVECLVRVVTKKDGRQVIEIEIPDEKARLRLAAALLRDGR